MTKIKPNTMVHNHAGKEPEPKPEPGVVPNELPTAVQMLRTAARQGMAKAWRGYTYRLRN